MGDVMIMNQAEETASRLGIDLAQLDLDSIHLPPGENCGIITYEIPLFWFRYLGTVTKFI